jgi:hypothetical protein
VSVCSSNCVLESEKNATSVPEINAEQINKISSVIQFIVISKSNSNAKKRNINMGSGSKF